MVQNQRITSFCVVLMALLLLMVNSVEPMPQSEPEIRRLVEIRTVDEKGLVRAHVVAVYEQKRDIEEQKTSSESDGEPKRYQDDDEDSKESSGDSSETYNGESYEMLARDDPLASSNQSSSESSGSPAKSFDSNINITQNPVDSKSSTAQPTTSQINATTSFPNTASLSTTNIETTTNPVTMTTATKVTYTREKQNATTLSLNTKTRDNLTTISPRVTEVSSTTPAQTTNASTTTTVPRTTTAAPTTTTAPKPTKIAPTTETNVSLSTPSNASTTARPNLTDHGVLSPTKAVRPSTGINPNVEGQKGPEKKARRKTLFGFVTVEILIALLAGALFSVLLVAFLVYRLKKRNEGSYELSETIALRPKEIDEMGKKKEVFV